MAFHAQLVVRISADRLNEEDVKTIISECGASVETILGRIAANGPTVPN